MSLLDEHWVIAGVLHEQRMNSSAFVKYDKRKICLLISTLLVILLWLDFTCYAATSQNPKSARWLW